MLIWNWNLMSLVVFLKHEQFLYMCETIWRHVVAVSFQIPDTLFLLKMYRSYWDHGFNSSPFIVIVLRLFKNLWCSAWRFESLSMTLSYIYSASKLLHIFVCVVFFFSFFFLKTPPVSFSYAFSTSYMII